MPTYVSLNKLTDKGIQTFKESPMRLDIFEKTLEEAGGKLIRFYLTMGTYDGVFIIEMPSDEAAATLALSIGGQGNVQTETLRAFNEDEYREIIEKI
ncbi:MAG: GYD domain-containing protein [Dehalococcoidia bacterium]|nr:MAG: GYD domain-containing protein [Dehalococcoidia bacterium]